ncbi:hypothetical protein DH2020_006736 [Rehmannia glutinosa]|uniref:Uncharacterized protein n=1 Tax=Rehmannia glutinosa TaxID=99300 RepID=A0ABR0XJR5_REHGL
MAAVGDVCMGELTKLRAKVIRAKNPLFLLKSWKRDASEKVEENRESKALKTARNEETMPETTVLLLMDRFAPC